MLPPRLALGTWGNIDRFDALWPAVDASLVALDIRPQWFHSQARPQCVPVPGSSRRVCYLDSWSMPAGRCAELLERGSAGALLAVVVGSFGPQVEAGGDLAELSHSLGMPRILVIDTNEALVAGLPPILELAGVILAGGTDAQQARATQRLQQQNLTIVGRASTNKVTWSPQFQSFLIAARDLDEAACRRNVFLRCRERRRWPLRIAIAYDEAFSGYFPETMSTLQGAGATFVDFSPLRNDCLPDDADVVYLGDGPIGDWLGRIAANHCFLHRLSAFAARGGKIVAEGRAAVCLCREARSRAGGLIPLAGVLPAVADDTGATDFVPLELRTEDPCWLARQGTMFQGYAPQHWRITCEEPDSGFITAGRILMQGNVLALPFAQHWASRPDLIRSFFRARGQRSRDWVTA